MLRSIINEKNTIKNISISPTQTIMVYVIKETEYLTIIGNF